METNASAGPVTDEWVADHFDHLSPALAREFHPTLARARSLCPVARSDAYEGGFWVLTRYEDVLHVAQDWQTFSSELGITVPAPPTSTKILPVTVDPPLQREFKRLVNARFTPAKIAPWEEPARVLVDQLIDGFIERGECDFMTEFARPFPGLAFFELALHAPAEGLEQVNHWARGRRDERGDRRPAHHPQEIIGTIHLLILGRLETTAGVLGAAMMRFCEHPEIPALLRERPDLIPQAVEELLRLDGSLSASAGPPDTTPRSTVTRSSRERAIMYWASANRDAAEFTTPDTFDLALERNRHIAFGGGPHRCVGSNLARMNLRVAIGEIVRRLTDVKLAPGPGIGFHSTFNRAPLPVPITFTPGRRSTAPAR
jgi:cytochrome P450